MRFVTELMRGSERLLGAVQIAEAQPHLADLIGAGSGLRQPSKCGELCLGSASLVLCLGELASKPHDLRALHPTNAGKAGDRLAFAPGRRRDRPLGGPAVVGDGAAHAEGDAVGCSRWTRPRTA